MIFEKSLFRPSDRPHHACIQVRDSAYIIDYRYAQIVRRLQWIEQQAIDGEITAAHIFSGALCIPHGIGMAAIGNMRHRSGKVATSVVM